MVISSMTNGQREIKEQVRQIHDILRRLDRGGVESEKVRKYLERCR